MMLNIDEEIKADVLRSIRKACDTYKHYTKQRVIELDLLGLNSENKDNLQWFDSFVRENGITIPKRPYKKHSKEEQAAEPELVVPEQVTSEPELVGNSFELSIDSEPLLEHKPLPDASDAMDEAMDEEVEAVETAAECEKVAEPAVKEPKSVTLDKAAVMAAYQLLAKNSQKIIDETEGKITLMRNTIDNLLETVEQEIDKMQQYECILEELEDAETAVFE